MGCTTTYAANGLLNLTLRGDTFTPPAAVYLGVFTSPPSADGPGEEIVGGGYAREEVIFPTPATLGRTTSDPIVWSTLHTANEHMTAGVGLFDAPTGGNMLAFERTPAWLVPAGRPFTISSFTIDSNDQAVTHYLANKWLDHITAVATFTPPANRWAGIYTTTPTATDAGVEVTGGGYTRAPADDWAEATNAIALTDTDLTWLPLHDTTEQDTTGLAILDAATAGNTLLFGSWPAVTTIPAEDTLRLPATSVGFRIL